MFEQALWFIFPVAIFIATIAMMSGIGGAILFTPFFIVILGMDPIYAVAAGLFIEVCGFTSGLIGYYNRKEINFEEAKRLIKFSLPATFIGVVISYFLTGPFVTYVLMLMLLVLGISFLFVIPGPAVQMFKRCSSRVYSAIGGLLMGLTSSGLGELDEYIFLKRVKLKPAVAAGTSVLMVAASAAIGVVTHLLAIVYRDAAYVFLEVIPVLIFAIPGVIIGAQIGIRVVERVSTAFMSKFLGVLFILLCGTLLASVI